jgi:regulator of replication initiation timing
MSTPSNFNQPNPAPYGSEGENPQKRTITIMGVVIGLLLLTSIFLLVSRYQTGKKLSGTQTELSEQKAAFAELDAQFNEAVTELEQQKGINAELDAKINEQLAQLEENKGKIETLIREKQNYRSAMNKFKAQKDEYLAELEQLKEQIGILTEQNTQLTSENELLVTNLTETQSQLEETNTAKAALISEKTQLETERQYLSQKVDVASAVKVSNIQVKAVAVTSSGKERTKSRAKKIDRLNICFTAEANEVVESGEENFFIIVTDPTGVPLYLETLGSGIVTDKRKGEEFRYTTVASVNYANEPVQACGAWEPGQSFSKGKYTVAVYNKGYKVGSGAFQLK